MLTGLMWAGLRAIQAGQEGEPLKTHDIEVQRLKSVRHDRGMIEVGADVLVQPRALRDDAAATSVLRLPVEDARTLLILLRQALGELDKAQPRSRRSGRA